VDDLMFKIAFWSALVITAVLLIFGLLSESIVAIFILLCFPIPGIILVSIAYLFWGRKPRKGLLVGTAIATIILATIYTIAITYTLLIGTVFGTLYDAMSKPYELTGKEAVNVIPEKIKPHLQNIDSSYYANIGWEEPYTFIGFNVHSGFRDSIILDWFGLDSIPQQTHSFDRSISQYEATKLPLLRHYWNPNDLNIPIYIEYTDDPHRYNKYAIYDSLGTRILLYSWYE